MERKKNGEKENRDRQDSVKIERKTERKKKRKKDRKKGNIEQRKIERKKTGQANVK